MERREFLVTAAAGAAVIAGVSPRARAQAAQRASQAKLDRIAIMTLNFQQLLKVPDTQPSPDRTLELFDLPAMIADTYGVHKIEFQHYHIASTEPAYLKDLRAAIEKSKSRMTQINVEFGAELTFSVVSQRYRTMTVDLTKRWVDHAVALGAQRVMVNQGTLTTVNKEWAIPTLKLMADYGRSKNIIVSVETRGGGGGRGRGGAAAAPGAPAPPPPPPPPPGLPETSPLRNALLAEVIKSAGAYSNVDVGGAAAANQQELHNCLRMMMPFTAGSMHTRVNQNWDLATCIRFLEKELGWGAKGGLYTIETGQGHTGTKEIYDVVVATL
jgi:hypothetical protein